MKKIMLVFLLLHNINSFSQPSYFKYSEIQFRLGKIGDTLALDQLKNQGIKFYTTGSENDFISYNTIDKKIIQPIKEKTSSYINILLILYLFIILLNILIIVLILCYCKK